MLSLSSSRVMASRATARMPSLPPQTPATPRPPQQRGPMPSSSSSSSMVPLMDSQHLVSAYVYVEL